MLLYNFGDPLNINRSPQVIDLLGSTGTGTSYAHSIGGGVQAFFPSLFSHRLSLSVAGGYELSRGEFTSNSYSGQFGTEQFHLSSNYGSLIGEALLAYDLGSRWSLEFGPRISYRVSNSLVQWREIVSNATAMYPNGGTRDTVTFGDAISSSRLHFTLPIGVTRQEHLTGNTTICYGIHATLDLNTALTGFFSEALGAEASLSLLFDFTRAPAKVVPPPPESIRKVALVPGSTPSVVPVPPAKEAFLHAAVHLEVNGVASRGALVREVDTLSERFAAIPRSLVLSGEVESLLKAHSIPSQPPYATRELIRSYRVPDLSVSRVVESEAGVARWSVRVRQAERLLTEYSSADSVGDETLDAAVSLGSGSSAQPIVAELTVTDTRGSVRLVSDTLWIQIDGFRKADTVREEIVTFVGNPQKSASHEDSLMLRYFTSTLESSGQLTLRPLVRRPAGASDLTAWVLQRIRTAPHVPPSIELRDEPIVSDTESQSVLLKREIGGVQLRWVH